MRDGGGDGSCKRGGEGFRRRGGEAAEEVERAAEEVEGLL